jgi:hypothetical protein
MICHNYDLFELDWLELDWLELDWLELDWLELDYPELVLCLPVSYCSELLLSCHEYPRKRL